MSNLRQAAEQALEALGRTVDCGHDAHECANVRAITALRAALAEPDRMTPKELAKRLERGEKWELAEPEQEPVAWMEMVVANLVREGINKHKARELAHHFAAPPQRLPLSDEHPLMVFAKECVLGAYSEKELADAANRAIKYAHSFKGEA